MSNNKNKYHLINPYIEGSINTIVDAKNAFNAGKKIYGKMSEHFTNHVENFNMSIMNVETNELTHFNIQEKCMNGGNAIDFFVNMLPNNLPKKTEHDLIKHSTELSKQSG